MDIPELYWGKIQCACKLNTIQVHALLVFSYNGYNGCCSLITRNV